MKIYSPGIDYQIFEAFKKDDQERYKKIFWLENKEDFVMICDSIFSPWREHLIQRFSNSFARIGLDGAVDSDFEKITKRLTED